MDNKSTSNELWYYAEGEAVNGPFTLPELLKKAEEGLLNAETLVVPEGQEEWRPLASLMSPSSNKQIVQGTSPPLATPPTATSNHAVTQKAGEPIGGPAPEKKQPTTKESAQGCGCLAVIVLVLGLMLKSCFSSGGETIVSEQKRAFPMTAEQFRAAFNKMQPRLKIESFKEEPINGEPWVSCVFGDGSGLKINLEPETNRICTVMCAFTKKPPEESHESYILANTVVYVLSPEANSADTWELVNRLTKEADGADDGNGKGELFRNLSVSMLSVGKSDSGLPLVMLLFTPRPAETVAAAAPAAPATASLKRYHHAQAGTPVYFFKPLYGDKPRSAFEYETLPSGAVRFIDAYDHREYCMTQPFEMKERPFPESAVEDGPAKDMSAEEQALNETLKYYLITSYATVKGYRYSTFRYAIDGNGTVHFDQRGSKLAIPPPYIIEENFVGKGNHPQIPDYPPSPDRG